MKKKLATKVTSTGQAPLNSETGTPPEVNSNATRGIGYTRIYRSTGGARRLAIPAFNAGTIDKGSDGRG